LAHALTTKPVVALGDAHWYGNVFDELMSLILDQTVLASCQHIVLEMGARRHQAWLNQYVALQVEDDLSQLRNVLLDSLVFTAWLAPHYLEFFQRVRGVNAERQAMQLPLIQLHLTEPEFDWAEVKTSMDYRALFMQRDRLMFECVNALQTENQRVIVLCGAWHLLKQGLPAGPKSFASLTEKAIPESVISIWPHMYAPFDSTLKALAIPTLLDLACHDLGKKPLSAITPIPPARMNINSVPTIHTLLDGYLYLGSQCRRKDYDFSVWRGIDQDQIIKRVSVMNPRQQDVLHTVLSQL
jgi:hypothetical protein